MVCKGSPYSTAERRVPELIPVLGSQPARDVSYKPGGRLPFLSARPAVTPPQPLRGLLPVLLLGEQRVCVQSAHLRSRLSGGRSTCPVFTQHHHGRHALGSVRRAVSLL